jgi:hypothetical protein
MLSACLLRAPSSFLKRVALSASAPRKSVNPFGGSLAILLVRKNESGPSPEEPNQSAGSLQIEVSSWQFDWLTKQCEFLNIAKQQLVADALEEWLCRHRNLLLPVDPSALVQKALDEFMRRHRDEFLPVPE